MRLLSWIIMIPTAVAVIVFAAFNRGATTLDFWPLPYIVTLPLFSVILSCLLLGFCLGGLVAWISAGRYRRRARMLARQLATAERDLLQLRDRDRRQSLLRDATSHSVDDPPGETRSLPPSPPSIRE